MIAKILVELGDRDATFLEFASIDAFLSSDLYKKETEVVTDAEVTEVPVEASPKVIPE